MYAELNVSLKSAMEPSTLSNALLHTLGRSAISPDAAVASTPLVGYIQQVVGAASFPDGTVVILPGAPAISSALIALFATLLGIVAEAVLASRDAESWKWKESQ